MKKFLLLLLIVVNTAFAQDTNFLLTLRTKNYNYLKNLYSELLSYSNANDDIEFCAKNDESGSKLVEVLKNDNDLIRDLREIRNPQFIEYINQLEENQPSPLFSHYAYQDMCQNSGDNFPASLKVPLERHITNIEYLMFSHTLFVQAFENSRN